MEPTEMMRTDFEHGLPERAAVFGKWLTVSFWMHFVPIIPYAMIVIALLNRSSTLPGALLGLASSAVTVAALFQLGKKEPRFRTCAGLRLISLCVGAAISLLRSEALFDLWTVPSEILTLIVEYQFMHGCREILLGIDNDLAAKWHALWKWTLGLPIGMFVGIFPLMLVVMILDSEIAASGALIVLLGVVIALITAAVLELVYLYRTANIFRRIHQAVEGIGPECFA